MIWLALCLSFFVLAVLLHAIARRFLPEINTVAIFAATGGMCGLMLLLSLLVPVNLAPSRIAAGLSLYAFLCELYIFAFTFVFGSVSASVLLSYLEGTSDASDEISVPPEVMVSRRLEGLHSSGLIREQSGFYQATLKGRLISAVGQHAGRFFMHDKAMTCGVRRN